MLMRLLDAQLLIFLKWHGRGEGMGQRQGGKKPLMEA